VPRNRSKISTNDVCLHRSRRARAGAIVGAVCGWVYLTEDGRRVRDQIAALDRFVDTLRQTRAASQDAKAALTEGRQLIEDIAASIRRFAS
jgi:hypothetical protein